MSADGGCELDVVHEGHKSWRALKSVLSNRGCLINTEKCLYKGIIVPMASYEQG